MRKQIKGFMKGFLPVVVLGLALKFGVDISFNRVNKHDTVARTLAPVTRVAPEPEMPLRLDGYREVMEGDKELEKAKREIKYHLLLERDTYTDKSTFGKLYLNGQYIAETLELPRGDNKKDISCIPIGVYGSTKRTSKSFPYKHLSIKNVEGRSEILIHAGNYPRDTSGCILIGNSRGENAVWNSRKTLSGLMSKLADGEVSLEVKEK